MCINTLLVFLRFDDLKSAFKTFKGDKKSIIKKWIQHFEEKATIFQLSEIQNLVFAKRVLRGQAKLFLEYESKATTINRRIRSRTKCRNKNVIFGLILVQIARCFQFQSPI